MNTPESPITQLLQRAAVGDRAALDAVFGALYPELRRIAHARLRGRGDGLGTTTLVHESFLRLVNTAELRLQDRRHFFTYAAKTMRHLIIDELRSRHAQRRGGGAEHLPIDATDAAPIAAEEPDPQLLRVHEALAELEALDPGLAELVEMRYFAGYREAEIAAMLGITERTVRRRWDKARAWLYLALQPDGATS
jgi:RNA polymerase sigma factor (TIGR02999 family)